MEERDSINNDKNRFNNHILNISDKDIINSYKLFHGIELYFLELHSDELFFSQNTKDDILLLSYCHNGRIGWNMGNNNYIYLGPHDYSLHHMSYGSGYGITIPNNIYIGLILSFNLNEINNNPPKLLEDTDFIFKELYNKFCNDKFNSSWTGNEETQTIFSAFFNQPVHLQMPYWRIKTIELLLYLCKTQPNINRQFSEYQSEQIEIVRQIHDHLIDNLDRRITIDCLSKQYLMNPTTLKNIFKAVYGTSLAAHVKEHRMEYASKLLLETDNTIVEISKAVGYDTQSKFTAAFKDYFHYSPLEYRKLHAKSHL